MFTTIHGLKTFYEEQGSGPAVLLLHGFPLDHRMWHEQIEALQSNYRVIAPDLRGFGQSEPHKDLITLDHMADELLLLLDQLQVEKAVLAGFSMGGYVAFNLLRKAPHRFNGLILANTRPDADPLEGQINRMKMAASLLEQGSQAASTAMIPKLLSDGENSGLARELQDQIEGMNPLGLVHASLAMAFRKDSTELLSTIQVPTLVIGGEKDSITTPTVMKKMADSIPNAAYTEIKDSAHLTVREHPDEVNKAITAFLGQLHS
ncbi:alpha/beta fold hydrolase [Paenibacillus sp. UNC499MF]|uniref:alpha/beta fold hydrolase n=1 Tax=Paenibacillus sp. UNC499MF TaxID=1502751 RepID=UPI00089FF7E2|nr:alpha/beta hydrolase [Paenibacillus sp. UNC499MF]SEG40006.1 Pimeloyl-ACP methyl ester carboxylesterase [Paenibacillus sp. UNC499MF]